MFAAYGGRTASNPNYIAAVKKQREKERQRLEGSIQIAGPTFLERLAEKKRFDAFRAQKEREQAAHEERFGSEFLYEITSLRLAAVEKAKQLLSNFEFDVTPKVRVRAEDIIRYHASQSHFSYEDIIGPRRYRPLVAVRQAAMADVYIKCPHLSMPQIAKKFGNRDHTTLYHALKKLGAHMSQTGQERAYTTTKRA